jgi:hypothetical protein
MRTVTNHFTSKSAALHYYSLYYRDFIDCCIEVARKIDIGEIRIGTPPLKPNEHLVLIDGGDRYAIENE